VNYEQMTVENVGDGALAKEFQRALARVLLDIEDETKPHEAKRTITLKVQLQPSDSTVGVVVSSSVALAPTRAFKSHAVLGHDGKLHQYRDAQEELPLSDKVRDIRGQQQKGGEE
jgi:hypothetical protein